MVSSRLGCSTNIRVFLKMAGQHDPVFFKTFPMGPDEEKRRFDLLRQAYVGARYHDDYKITPQELKYLARCVELLQQRTKASCEEKMDSWSEA